MKLYDFVQAPNPRRVRIFIAEKGITIPTEQVNLATADNRKPEFLAKNPNGTLPVLELDDGTQLAESVAISRYLEELHPEPNLFGKDAKERALVEMWNRRMELDLLSVVAGSFRNTSDFFKGRIPQSKEYGEICKNGAMHRLTWMDKQLEGRKFIAGDRFTIADITALVGVDFGRVTQIRIQPEQKNLQRWYESVSSRPSAKA